VRLIYRAAQELGTGFKLFFSVDMSDVTDILDVVRTYARHPNQLIYRNRIVVSTFSQERLAWKEKVLSPLKAEGVDVFFVPYFYPRAQATELPDYPTVAKLLQQHAGTVDGLFYFGAAGTASQLAEANGAYARALREAGMLWMASYTPTYWQHSQPPGRYFAELLTPPRHCHAGYLELSRYFITWYKSGKQPPIERDSLFYFYRTHAKDAVAARDDHPVTNRIGEVNDTLYITTLLTAPAELCVYSGANQTRYPVAAGIQHLRVPYACGPQRFELMRHGESILTAEGQSIDAEIERYDFFTASGFAHGPMSLTGR
jgi:glucan endo-1,3-alpha-glucosidase